MRGKRAFVGSDATPASPTLNASAGCLQLAETGLRLVPWQHTNGDGQPRDGAWVAELTGQVNLANWPQGTRLIVRRERPHPGAQLSFTDVDGHRFQCFITDQGGDDLAVLDQVHRQHAEVEDRIKTFTATGGSHLPFTPSRPTPPGWSLR